MSNPGENFKWAERLECPAEARTDAAKKLLNQGIISLLWDDLAPVLHPTKETIQVRKNILLYKLKHGETDVPIQQIRSMVQCRTARSSLDAQFESLEKECDKTDFQARQKQQQLLKLKSLRHMLKIKEKLLRIKFNQVKTQVEVCKEMRLICQSLMPATRSEIDPNIIDESLSLVSEIFTRTDRKMVWNRILENFIPIEISTLWNILLSRRTRDTEELMELSTREIPETQNKSGEIMDIGIARACGQYVAAAAQRLIHRANANKQQKLVMEYIEKIESSEANVVDVSEWLALTLEVRKFETEQKTLESEIDALKKTLEQQSLLTEELSNLESDMHNIDRNVEKCVEDIQKCLSLLKPAGLMINCTRDKLMGVLQKIVALRSENTNVNYLDIDLSTEVSIFNDTLQLEALRKIILKDNVAAYRHTKCCISEATLAIVPPPLSDFSSQFPMIRAPVYHLLDCYKNLVTESWLTMLENNSHRDERSDLGDCGDLDPTDLSDHAIEVLNATDLACDRVREEIRQFDSIFDAWRNQTVQKAMALDDSVVNGATFKEWVKRYNNLLYMVQRTK